MPRRFPFFLRCCGPIAACCVALSVQAAQPAPLDVAADARLRLMNERQALQDQFAEAERACQQRFAVSACVDDVRVRRRAALAPLRERELQLNDEQRRQRAQEREAARVARRTARETQALMAPAPAASRPQATPATPRPTPPRQAQPDPSSKAAEAAARAKVAQQRREAAQASQAEVARRLAQRKVEGKSLTALPTPEAASMPGAAVPR